MRSECRKRMSVHIRLRNFVIVLPVIVSQHKEPKYQNQRSSRPTVSSESFKSYVSQESMSWLVKGNKTYTGNRVLASDLTRVHSSSPYRKRSSLSDNIVGSDWLQDSAGSAVVAAWSSRRYWCHDYTCSFFPSGKRLGRNLCK